MKRIKLLFLVMGLILATFSAQATIYDEESGLNYNIFDDGTAEVAPSPTYDGDNIKELEIPAEITYDGKSYKVTKIGNKAFSPINYQLPKVSGGANITTIGANAFKGLTSLTTVDLSGTVTSIGEHAFDGCTGLSGIGSLLDKVTEIGDCAFQDCEYLDGENINLNGAITYIGDYAFNNCTTQGESYLSMHFNNLTNASIGYAAFSKCLGLNTINGTVSSIGTGAFAECERLSSIGTVLDNVTEIPSAVFYGCTGLYVSLTLNSAITSIGSQAFAYCPNLELHITNLSNATIGESAFEDCFQLKDITGTVSSIGSKAFWGCDGLEKATIYNTTPPTVGTDPFYMCYDAVFYVLPNALESYKAAEVWKDLDVQAITPTAVAKPSEIADRGVYAINFGLEGVKALNGVLYARTTETTENISTPAKGHTGFDSYEDGYHLDDFLQRDWLAIGGIGSSDYENMLLPTGFSTYYDGSTLTALDSPEPDSPTSIALNVYAAANVFYGQYSNMGENFMANNYKPFFVKPKLNEVASFIGAVNDNLELLGSGVCGSLDGHGVKVEGIELTPTSKYIQFDGVLVEDTDATGGVKIIGYGEVISTPTAVEAVKAADDVKIFAADGAVSIVPQADCRVEIYDTAGRRAATANAAAGGLTSVPLVRGYYIVRAAGTSRAVAVQ